MAITLTLSNEQRRLIYKRFGKQLKILEISEALAAELFSPKRVRLNSLALPLTEEQRLSVQRAAGVDVGQMRLSASDLIKLVPDLRGASTCLSCHGSGRVTVQTQQKMKHSMLGEAIGLKNTRSYSQTCPLCRGFGWVQA